MVKRVYCLLLVWSICFNCRAVNGLELMLPQVYEENRDIAGWLVSEKLDGVRGFWDGKMLLSKNGTPFHPPAEFLNNFPEFALEGELWGGRGTFEQTIGIVKQQKPHRGWLELSFAIFDVPEADGGFVQRLKKASQWFAANPSNYALVIPQKRLADTKELEGELRRVESLGGEGVMVRKPDTLYHKGRSSDILKVKSYQDMEAKIVGHLPGTGKNQGKLGSLLVELANGKRFKIGTGLSDAERRNPPQIGTTITFKYYGLYQSGLPKFASFLRVRLDDGL